MSTKTASTLKKPAKRPMESQNNLVILISVGCVAVLFPRVGNFGKETRLATENLFVESVHDGHSLQINSLHGEDVTRLKLADVLHDLGF